MYKKFTKDQFPLEAEHMAVDTGTGTTTGWDYMPRTDPEEGKLHVVEIFCFEH